MRGEALGHASEHAAAVVNAHVHVERRGELASRQLAEGAPGRIVLEEAGALRADDRHHVGDHGRGRLDAAGAWAFQHDLADRVTLQHHGVEGAADRGERVLPVDEGGPDAHVVALTDEGCGANEAHHHLQLARRGDVRGRDAGDALVVDVAEHDPRAEGDRGEDRHLCGRIGAANVLGRIGLGVAQALRFSERACIVGATLHRAQHEVGGAVDDAQHAPHVRHDQRLAQHLDHGDGRAHRRLEAQLDACRLRRAEQVSAPLREQLLVGGHDGLARREQVAQVAGRRVESAHHLGDDLDRRVVADLGEVGGEDRAVGQPAARPLRVAHERLDDAQPVTGGTLDVVGILGQQPVHGRADGAVAEQGDGDVNSAVIDGCHGRHATSRVEQTRPDNGVGRHRPMLPSTSSGPVTGAAARTVSAKRASRRRPVPSAASARGGSYRPPRASGPWPRRAAR